MKHLLLTFVLLSAALVPSVHAVSGPPFFGTLRTEVINQQVIASNATVPDKKLLSALKKALTTIDKTKTDDYVAGTKSLGVLLKTLNHTSVSNAFAGVFDNVVDVYLSALMNAEDALADRLAGTFPSGPHTAAQNNLDQLLAALQAATTDADLVAAAKALSLASKKLVVAAKLTDKAEDVPPPPAQIIADVAGAINISIKTQGAVITGTPLQFNLLGGSGSASGQKTITFSLQNVSEGTHMVNLVSGAFIITSASPATYSDGTGTATVTYNSANHSLFGTFTFTASGASGSTGTVTVSGSFNGSTP
jgi:hypothetical protein